jgi:hypothetical protein
MSTARASQTDTPDMQQDEATQVMLLLRKVLRDSEFTRRLVALVTDTPDGKGADYSEPQRKCARWNRGRRP